MIVLENVSKQYDGDRYAVRTALHRPIHNRQVRHSAEVPYVVRHDGRPVFQRDGRDTQVHLAHVQPQGRQGEIAIQAASTPARRIWHASAEAEAFARLQHPNIVQIYEVGEHDGRPFFSLEFCAGGSLDEEARRHAPAADRGGRDWSRRWRGRCTPPTRQGVVHRDLKPANVLLRRTARRRSPTSAWRRSWTRRARRLTGAVMGTPSYMAPEQAGGKRRRSARRQTSTPWAPSSTSC